MATLEAFKKQKRYFDLNNKNDVELYRQFLINNAWGGIGCPFILEFPYLTTPDMIKDKLVRKFLKV
jgi:hypothetical protein